MRTNELLKESLKLLELGNLNEALEKLNHALIIDPSNTDVKKQIAVILIQQDKTEDAVTILDDILKTEDDNIDLLFVKANCLNDLENPSEALELYNKILRIQPGFCSAYGARGIALMKTGQVDKALEDLNTAIKKADKNALFLTQRAFIFIEKQDFKAALKDLNKALRIDKHFSLAKLNRSFVLRMLGEKEKALKDIENVDTSEDFDSEIFHQKGIIYFKNKDYHNALKYYNTAIELDQENVEAVYSRSIVLCELGDFANSIKDLNSALKMDSSHFMDFILNGFAYVYYKMKDFEKAIEYANRTLFEFPGFYWANLTLAKIYGEIDNKDEFYKNLSLAIEGGIGLEDIDKRIREKYARDKQFKRITKDIKQYGPYG